MGKMTSIKNQILTDKKTEIEKRLRKAVAEVLKKAKSQGKAIPESLFYLPPEIS